MSTMSDLSVQVIEAIADDLVYLAEQGKTLKQATEVVAYRIDLESYDCIATALEIASAKLANRQRYKVWVIADSSGHWATNAKEFDSQQEADDWGFDLSCRWFAVQEYCIRPVGDDPNKEVLEGAKT